MIERVNGTLDKWIIEDTVVAPGIIEEGVFKCRFCGEILPLSLKKEANGNICKKCFNEEARHRHKINSISARILVELIKRECGCQICGKEKEPVLLDFHHFGIKKHKVSDLVCWGRINQFLDEIKNCKIICSECHRLLHHKTPIYPYNFLLEDFL